MCHCRYCPSGSGSPTPVPLGYFSTPTSAPLINRYNISVCPAGQYCVNGTAFDCPSGTYNLALGRSTVCQDACPPGYFCPAGTGALSPSIACTSPLHFCPQGSSTPWNTSNGYFALATSQQLYYNQVCERVAGIVFFLAVCR